MNTTKEKLTHRLENKLAVTSGRWREDQQGRGKSGHYKDYEIMFVETWKL